MAETTRLRLPLLRAGQAQKELFHNEALQLLDVLVCGTVEEPPRTNVPADPPLGGCYIIGTDPTGDWSGRAGQLAAWTAGGWRFVMPTEGMALVVRSDGATAVYRAGTWDIGTARCTRVVIGGQQVVGAQVGAIGSPAGGTTVDLEARASINAILHALRGHGLIAPST